MFTEQIDYLAFAVFIAVIYAWVGVWLKRSRGLELPAALLAATVMIVGAGWFPVQRAGETEARRVRDMVTGFAPTYAAELARLGHARVADDAPPHEPTLLALIDAQKRWMALNPAIVSIYTMRQRADGNFIFIAGAEVDYDRNGVYEGEREQRSLPGDVYKDAGSFWLRGLAGETAFDEKPYTDEWGTWVSAVTPMRAADGRIEGVLGVDYDATRFVHAIAAARGVVIGTVGLLLLSMLSLTVILTLQRAHLDELRAAEQLRREKALAEASNKAKSEFLANMSHELRTPMHAIISFSRLGLDKAGAGQASLDKLGHYFHRISDSSERLLRLLDDLLDLAKLDAGRMHYEWCELDLPAVLSDAVNEFDALARRRGVRLVLSAEALPGVRADRLRIGQVLRNLLSNAIKFSPEGATVRVLAAPVRGTPGADPAIRISIRDQGVGIPEGELERVFDQFVQSSKTRTSAGGTGLGLSIVRAIVTAHGGRVWAENNPEGGAAFHVELPAIGTTRHGPRDAGGAEASAEAEPLGA